MHMERRTAAVAAVLALALGIAGCDDAAGPDPDTLEFTFDFNAGMNGWEAGFADYPEGGEENHALESGHRPLPAPLNSARRGAFLSGRNHSDDLLMYMTRPVAGLEPNAMYGVNYEVEFATQAPSGCSGVGGAPGESVFVKTGAAPMPPVRVVDDQAHYRLQYDIGNQAQGGAHALTIGNIAGPGTDCFNPAFALKTLASPRALTVQADAEGRIWLFVGVDSGFESTTSVYFTRVEVRFQRNPQAGAARSM